MKKRTLAVAIVTVILYQVPAFANEGESGIATAAHPVAGLIGDWRDFRDGMPEKTIR